MGRRLGVLMAVVATAAALALGACSTAEPTEPPGAAATSSTASTSVSVPSTTTSTSTSTTGAPADGWYLALGDSLAAGLQPTTGDQKTRGYAGPVLEGVRKT